MAKNKRPKSSKLIDHLSQDDEMLDDIYSMLIEICKKLGVTID